MIKGSCLCGAVVFEISGEITPIQYCHAERCRKATGGAFSPEALVPIDAFSWASGEDNLSHYEAPLLNGPPAYRKAFCSTCGSPMPEKLEGMPFMFLNPGVLDDDPVSRPFRHAYTGQMACWHEIADAMPQHQALPDGPTAETL